ncbi:hypothetical protein TSUD_147160 [Trifolium subterraneum]|uniref:Aminotransferase-like plant mobile domain-containing protein n=1 Tax=Trifolium subterraneum TaxID=3900 RepID=A0A2Z6MBR2_TRISU|nr:hypothetical protein TSUD_147160 [Trifolium subterraneum]
MTMLVRSVNGERLNRARRAERERVLYMENTPNDVDKGKRPTEASAFSRREKMEIHGNDVVRQMEVEEMERKGDEDTSKVRRLTWVNPYEGKHEPKKFSGGPSDKTVLLEYRSTPHIARCVYNGFDRELIKPVSNGRKMNDINCDVFDLDLLDEAVDAAGMSGLGQTGYSFLDPPLLSTFVERWHGETSSFHMPSGEMTVTLDDVRHLLHLPIKGRLLDHTGIPTKVEGIELMISLIGSTEKEATHEVKTTKGAHAKFVYLRALVKKHKLVVKKADKDGDKDTLERYKGYIVRAYLLLLVGTTIFSNKAKSNVDLTCLKYFRDLDQIHTYAWGTAALAVLYRVLSNAIVPLCKYVAGYMTLLQAWIYDHFEDTSGSLNDEFLLDNPRATKYESTNGCGPIKVKYLPERVLWQFGYVQTIPRHPDAAANILTIVHQIDQHWHNYTDRVLTSDMLGSRATILSDIAPGYMTWYFKISHPYIVRNSTRQFVVPTEYESDVAVLGRLASICDILNGLMINDEVPNGSHIYKELESACTLTFVPNQGGPGSSSQR